MKTIIGNNLPEITEVTLLSLNKEEINMELQINPVFAEVIPELSLDESAFSAFNTLPSPSLTRSEIVSPFFTCVLGVYQRLNDVYSVISASAKLTGIQHVIINNAITNDTIFSFEPLLFIIFNLKTYFIYLHLAV